MVPSEAAPPGPEVPLDGRVLTALQGLGGRLAFSGLRRMLGAHPESLARSLRRLEREGLVERVTGGYRALRGAPAVDVLSDRGLRVIAKIELPPGSSPAILSAQLAGRWFGTLRWVGLLERPEGELLAWARRDAERLVLLSVRGRELSVLVRSDAAPDDPSEAEEAAYELLFHAAEALRPTPPAGPAVAGPLRAFELGPTAPYEN